MCIRDRKNWDFSLLWHLSRLLKNTTTRVWFTQAGLFSYLLPACVVWIFSFGLLRSRNGDGSGCQYDRKCVSSTTWFKKRGSSRGKAVISGCRCCNGSERCGQLTEQRHANTENSRAEDHIFLFSERLTLGRILDQPDNVAWRINFGSQGNEFMDSLSFFIQ